MKTLEFTTSINAPREKVWKTLWEDETYRKWTTVFSEGSHAVSTWKEGARIHFLGPGGGGMFSEIAKLVPNEHMAFRHLGEVKEGKEQPHTEETKKWEGAMETYTLKANGNAIELRTSVDVVDGHVDFFNDTFPKALDIVKKISEE